MAFWVISTWFAEFLFAPVTLWISGPDAVRAMLLFRILRYLCRRGVILAGLTPGKLQALPMAFRPTLLLSQPSSSVLKLLFASTFRGVLVPGRAGEVQDLRCAKAIFGGTRALPPLWNSQTVHLPLSPLDDPASHPSERSLMKAEDYFQSRLLQYRLDHWSQVRDSRFTATGLDSRTRESANAICACIRAMTNLHANWRRC